MGKRNKWSNIADRVSSTFTECLSISADSIDALGHVSNREYFNWILDIAERHSAAVGYDQQRYLESGKVFVVRKQEIEYLRPAFEAETIHVDTWIESFSHVATNRRTTIRRGTTVLVEATTMWVLVELKTMRPTRLTAELKQAFDARS